MVLELEVFVDFVFEIDTDALVEIVEVDVLGLEVNTIAFEVNVDVFEVVVLVFSVELLVCEANVGLVELAELLLLDTAKFIRLVNAYPSDEVKFKAAELG